MTDLGTNGQKASEALAINERGQIVGISFMKTDRYANTVVTPRGFVWRNGRTTDLGSRFPTGFNNHSGCATPL